MQKICWTFYFLRIIFPDHLFWLIFLGMFLVYTSEVSASQSAYDGDEKMHYELFSDRMISAGEYRQNCNNGWPASGALRNSVQSAVSVNLESVFPLVFYVGTNREFLKKAKHKLLFNNSENILLNSGSPTIPLLAIRGTLHPGVTQMGFSLLSLLHLPFFQSGRFGLGQR
jgi:hypothetical protein